MRHPIPLIEEVDNGNVTDKYFERTEAALEHANENPRVVAEVTADQFGDMGYEVLAGLKDVAALLEDLPVDADALREGEEVDGGPVMRIEGHYQDFARHETALLGFLSHASGVATAAREVARAAGDVPVYSFGTRHVHPMISVMVERAAYIGGVDGYSNIAGEPDLPEAASGTMPHALMLAFGRGRKEEAWAAFNQAVDSDVPRIVLTDTYTDEVEETRRAARLLGDDLDGVRLDTTGSRRGDFEHIVREVRYTLDRMDREDVDIFVSGGLGPKDLHDLREHADGFGVGSYIAAADPVDFSLDIVERNGEPISKRGKLGGVKDRDMEPLVEDGTVVREFDVEAARERDYDFVEDHYDPA